MAGNINCSHDAQNTQGRAHMGPLDGLLTQLLVGSLRPLADLYFCQRGHGGSEHCCMAICDIR